MYTTKYSMTPAYQLPLDCYILPCVDCLVGVSTLFQSQSYCIAAAQQCRPLMFIITTLRATYYDEMVASLHSVLLYHNSTWMCASQ